MKYELTREDILMYAVDGAITERGIHSGEDGVESIDRDIEELEHRLEQLGVQEELNQQGLDVQYIDFKSTDAFLVKVDALLTQDQAVHIRDWVRDALGVKHVLVIDNNVTLAIMRREEDQDT